MEEVCVKALKQHVWHNLSVTVIDIYTHTYIYVCVCVCVCINKCYFFVFWHKHHKVKDKPLSASEIICATFTRRRTSSDVFDLNYSPLFPTASQKTGARGPAAAERAEPPHQLLHQRPSCGANQVCAPTAMRVERVLLLEGPREVEVVEECDCEVKLSQCLRVPALRTYYSETPYETVVDVGGCSRSKGSPEGFSCVPTKFDSALVETPNKVDLIQTVVTCELKESCYRVPYVEYYYEIVHHADGVKEERLKEIDVGRCLGGCTTGNRCLLRSPSNPELCHLWAERQSSSCVPQGYESQSFLNQHGLLRTVLSITSCLCQN
ncbi:uncharacterized protein pnhd isoform X1 [Scophthalmus maximus]|uniref:uncharacterized protein pnhd isoform X1 n=1 Tax=Scophthalmus maximus TaxID=52904 RepID=UPI001FA8A734|nr:uncharacterized protein pnhd isoform X1 [Scophthalmus maximus]XP_047187735.1 uncharacterized protein pnhd isoform X1 [Scophthalmus maximus]